MNLFKKTGWTSNIVNLISGKLIVGKYLFLVNILAGIISWNLFHSIGLVVLHYVFGFWFIVYSMISYLFNLVWLENFI